MVYNAVSVCEWFINLETAETSLHAADDLQIAGLADHLSAYYGVPPLEDQRQTNICPGAQPDAAYCLHFKGALGEYSSGYMTFSITHAPT